MKALRPDLGKKKDWTTSLLLCIGICLIMSSCGTPRRETRQISDNVLMDMGKDYVRLSEGLTHYEVSMPERGAHVSPHRSRTVVLVHGAMGPMCIWDNQFQALKAHGFKALRYDMYGRGFSDRPQVEYDRQLYVRQLNELLDFAYPGEIVDLVGISMGGATVINFASHYPDRVGRVVLIAPIIDGVRGMSLRRFLVRIPLLGDLLFRAIGVSSAVRRATASVKPSDHCKALLGNQTEYDGFERAFLSMLRSDVLGDYTEAYLSVGRQEGRDVLLIWGTADDTISENMIQKIKEAIPYVTEAKLDNVGHGAIFEKPAEVNALIMGFLAESLP